MQPAKVISIPLLLLVFTSYTGIPLLSHSWNLIGKEKNHQPYQGFENTIFQAPEICDNGIDDDGDGFVDLFDQDCACDQAAYQAFCKIECEQLPDSFPDIELRLKWQSEIIVNEDHNYPNIVVGDINHDGVVDIVTKKYFEAGNGITNGVVVFNGNNGTKLSDHTSVPRNVNAENLFVSIADVDRDGFAEFFYSREDTIICVRQDGSIRWKSDRLNEEGGYCVNLADFNGDGIPEAYKGSNIVNALTGRVLVRGGSGGGCNMYTADCSISHTIAAELLPAPGLELAAGNTVYEVVITNTDGLNGNSMIAHNANNGIRDGMTSVGDIDGDELLDIVVVRSSEYNDNGGVWVWNPRTGNVIARANAGDVGGIAFIGNVAGDCKPEIGVNFRNSLRMYTYNGTTNLQVLYNLSTSDGSGYTGVTMFDFNQDGKNELVYRDEDLLRVMEGSTGATLDAYPVYLGTGMDYPVIADVDGDNEAEILVTGYLNTPTQQRLFCFESGGAAWAPARHVWNQPGYHVTNVNDDLTIPRYPQHQATALIGYENCLLPTCPSPYNAFMAQATFRTQEGCVQFPAIDLALELLSTECEDDSISICYVVTNLGDQAVAQKNIGFAVWPSSPLKKFSPALAKVDLLLTLPINASDTFCFKMSSANLPDSIFMAANDPGNVITPYDFPVSDIAECRYFNNIDSLDLQVHTIVMVTDTAICEGESILFHDSLVTKSGSYMISGSNCDSLFNLELIVHDNDTLLFHQMICFGDSILFDGNWLSATGNYEAKDINRFGCDSTTYIDLEVASQILEFDTISICQGDSALINGTYEKTEDTYITIRPGVTCDTALNTFLEVYLSHDFGIAYDACPGDTFYIADQVITSSMDIIEYEQTIHGCDSIIRHFIAMPAPTEPPTFYFDCDSNFYVAEILPGADWFHEWSNGDQDLVTRFYNAGIESVTLYGGLACEEHYEIDLPPIPDPAPLFLLSDTSVLENHSFSISLGFDPNDWSIVWTPSDLFSCEDCFTTFLYPTAPTTVNAYLTHKSGCEYAHSFLILIEPIVDLYIPNVFSPNDDSVNDYWTVTSPGERLEMIRVDVFDRWGDHIAEWNDVTSIKWNGTFHDKPLNPGVFAYTILYLDQEDKQQIKQGNITLLR